MSILIRSNTPWVLKEHWDEAEGRALFVKGTLGATLVTLVNLYLPNSNQIAFLERIMTILGDFAKGEVLLGGGPEPPYGPDYRFLQKHTSAFL